MNPVNFAGANKLLEPPPGMTAEECSPLPILNMAGQCISCWKPTWKERLQILLFGRIWLGVLFGDTQPPVYLTAERPFKVDGGQ